MKDAVAVADNARVTAEKQKDEANEKFAKANKQITTLEQERDAALGEFRNPARRTANVLAGQEHRGGHRP